MVREGVGEWGTGLGWEAKGVACGVSRELDSFARLGFAAEGSRVRPLTHASALPLQVACHRCKHVHKLMVPRTDIGKLGTSGKLPPDEKMMKPPERLSSPLAVASPVNSSRLERARQSSAASASAGSSSSAAGPSGTVPAPQPVMGMVVDSAPPPPAYGLPDGVAVGIALLD